MEEELDRLVTELNIPYELTEFQRIGACVLGSGKSLFLIVPTGEGKLTVGLLASHLLRRVRNQPNGVAIITQPLTREFLLPLPQLKIRYVSVYPLSGLMMEQINIPWTNVAVLSMSGKVNVGDEEGEAHLLGSFEDLLSGKYQVLVGHPESFTTAEGQRILNELSRLNLISMVVVDEVHKYLFIFRALFHFLSLPHNLLDYVLILRSTQTSIGTSARQWPQPVATFVLLHLLSLPCAS